MYALQTVTSTKNELLLIQKKSLIIDLNCRPIIIPSVSEILRTINTSLSFRSIKYTGDDSIKYDLLVGKEVFFSSIASFYFVLYVRLEDPWEAYTLLLLLLEYASGIYGSKRMACTF